LASETNAATSEINAAAGETNAAASESAAAVSAANAATSEANASTSEASAATSAANAATSEANAATSETNAAASESAAATSEANAAVSEANAAVSAASAVEAAASTSASETNASQSAAAAASSAAAAATSAASSGNSALASANSSAAAANSAALASAVSSGTKDRGTVVNALISQGSGYGITAVTVSSGGSGYMAGDALIIGNMDSLVEAIIVVNAVDINGAITNITLSKTGVWPTSTLGEDLVISGGQGAGFIPDYTIGEVAYTTLADIPEPRLNDTAYVVQDEIHNSSTYLWKFADYNGDGIANWVPITTFASTIKPASTTQAGIVELATSNEAIIGTDDTRAVTPYTLSLFAASRAPHIERSEITLESSITAGTTISTPTYTFDEDRPGAYLHVYVDGVLMSGGRQTLNGINYDNAFYRENTDMTSITILDSLPEGATLTFIAYYLA
jgi:hypothetical protein